MLETIREYGRDRLGAGAVPALRRRHRDWYRQLIEKAGDEWFGPLQQDWATRLRLEHANLRGALEYCLSQPGEARVSLRMAAAPWFWMSVAMPPEGRLWLDRALALDKEPSHERAWALATARYIAVFQGDVAAGMELPEKARELAVHLDDRAALAYATYLLGVRQYLSSDLAGAVPLLVEALERYADVEVTEQYPNSLRIQLAIAYLLLGELDNAAEVVDELYERCERAGERWLLSYALWGRGLLSLTRGDLDQAEAHLREALETKRFFHDNLGLALALDVIAWTTVVKGEAERAAVLLGGANQLWQTIGAPLFGSMHLIARRDQFEQMARKKIGDAAFDTAFARGSALVVEDLLALALREGTHPAAPTQHEATDLTRREREVADLVADGMSNKDLAARLVVSPRTAEAHIQHILTKLGFNSRAQIASWVAQQRADRR